MIALTAGCFVPITYEKTQTAIPPGGFLQIEIYVAEDEVIEGSWRADETIDGSYECPDGTKFSWLLPSAEHKFLIKGEENPGLYVFSFRNSGDEAGMITLRYRIKDKE